MAYALSDTNAVEYLLGTGLISASQAGSATAVELGGGVSNVVVKVDMADPSGSLIIKQSLPRLRVHQEWLADQARIHREASALRYLRGCPAAIFPASRDPRRSGTFPVRHDRRAGRVPGRGRTISSPGTSIRG